MQNNQILEKVQEFIEHYNLITPETFKEVLTYRYKLALLDNLSNAFFSERWLENVEAVLSQNWEMIKNSALCYTAMPEDEVTLLLCEIAHLISIEKKQQNNKNKSALSFLMPGLRLKSVKEDYRNLDEEEVLIQEVLKKHIISDCGQYLVPVKILLDMALTTSCDERFDNPYYYYKLGEKSDYIENETCDRLFLHSDITLGLRAEKVRYYEILAQDQSLYKQLFTLIQALYLNGKEGKGTEESAGDNAYVAILNFNEYYSALNPEEINSLPPNLKNAIEKLLKLSSDEKINTNAVENFDTCISNHRQIISEAMLNHRERLAAIGLSKENQNNLLIRQENKFNQSKEAFRKFLQENYSGTEKRKLNKSLLDALGVVPQVRNKKELEDVLSFDKEELKVFFSKKEELADEIVNQFSDIEELREFFVNTLNEKLEVILPIISKKLYENALVKDYQSLIYCFITLEIEKLHIVAHSLIKGIAEEFSLNSGELMSIISPLEAKQRSVVFEALLNYLPPKNLIKKYEDLFFIRYLLLDECKFVLDKLKPHLLELIENSEHEYRGNHLWYWLERGFSNEHRALIINTIIREIDFKKIIRSDGDLYLLTFLPLSECERILNSTKLDWSEIISSASELDCTINLLPENEQRKLIISEMTKNSCMVNMFKDLYPNDLCLLTDDERNIIRDAINNLSIGNTSNNFLLLYRQNIDLEQSSDASFAEKKDVSHSPRP